MAGAMESPVMTYRSRPSPTGSSASSVSGTSDGDEQQPAGARPGAPDGTEQ